MCFRHFTSPVKFNINMLVMFLLFPSHLIVSFCCHSDLKTLVSPLFFFYCVTCIACGVLYLDTWLYLLFIGFIPHIWHNSSETCEKTTQTRKEQLDDMAVSRCVSICPLETDLCFFCFFFRLYYLSVSQSQILFELQLLKRGTMTTKDRREKQWLPLFSSWEIIA